MWAWRFDPGSPGTKCLKNKSRKEIKEVQVWGIDLGFPRQKVYDNENHKEKL